MSLINSSAHFRPIRICRRTVGERLQLSGRSYAALSAHLDANPNITWWTSRDSRHKIFNLEWTAFMGIRSLRHSIFNESRSVHPADIAPLTRAVAALYATEEPQKLKIRLMNAHGEYSLFDADIHLCPMHVGRGEGFIVECKPIGGCGNAAR